MIQGTALGCLMTGFQSKLFDAIQGLSTLARKV